MILSCALQGLDSDFWKALEGKRYGFVEDEELGVDVRGREEVGRARLKEEVSSYY